MTEFDVRNRRYREAIAGVLDLMAAHESVGGGTIAESDELRGVLATLERLRRGY